MLRTSRFLLITLSLLLAFTISAYAKTYKIGATLAVTGGASFLGDPEKKTLLLLEEQINAAGGINGNKIEIIIMDDGGSPAKARTNVARLIRKEKVVAIIGSSTSGASIAIGKLAKRYKVPLISLGASIKIVYDIKKKKTLKWVFKTPQTDTMVVENMYANMNKLGIERIAILSSTSGFGQSGRAQVLNLAKQYNMEIVADEKHGKSDSDVNAQMINIKKKRPQALIHFAIGSPAILSVRTWNALKMNKIKFFHSHGFGSPKNLKILGDDANGVYFPLGNVNIPQLLVDGHPQKAAVEKYHRDYIAKYNEPVSSFGGHAWDALYMLVKALKAVGPNRSKVRDYLEGNIKSFVGMHGIFNMSKDDHIGLDKSSLTLLQVRNGNVALAN